MKSSSLGWRSPLIMMVGAGILIIGAQALSQTVTGVNKVGSRCPRNYTAVSENYCSPNQGAQPAVIKLGSTCPAGYEENGQYCLKRKLESGTR
ncbi:hypothetical protein L3556_14305 [Candidatus Synechococcus calcipolaris G9]|uniref:Uncharacterized protein n=1 Tax=Candidatus Synechococcus calcipolaris G9 TaxID=1497997 RepID=A0ABT6F2K4_9SYNE|nr:hypothetical protein [Candidatus Synechococcus calcipolaris]MDG2992094.1 hypothetical protein [Candidatus Synechococcus calcipolaris G9]